ncbi:ABC transporter permease [Mucilaginibacter lappiensis]|uniref:Putative ABC transport system permease protein n=1 Tax=Mucilaginibacter lappiensis TaxID=354630 RepID=A0A841JBC2_9SPHI|nr:ABC transporter permease [Mucilaginibacter lappiensis]MBB6127944.1 putative ABC transport system permease protein [Mucilaginibacter lappiensis]
MNTEDRIWNLVIKKLTHEASEQELQELAILLSENPDIDDSVNLMLKWWQPQTEQTQEGYSYFLFKKILNRIKEAETKLPLTNLSQETKAGNFEPGFKKKALSNPINHFVSHITMIKNYLKIAVRQLLKQKMYAAIKVGGFALSIAACLLIALYIREELSFDKSYPDADSIYRIVGIYNMDNIHEKGVDWPAVMGRTMKTDFPEVEKFGRLMPNSLFWGAGSNELKRSDAPENTHEEGFVYADQSLLDILKLPMIYGDRAHALAEPLTMVISKSKADKYFPGQNPVGKVMYLNNNKSKPYKIGAVMQDIPTTSHLHEYNFFLTLAGVEFWNGEQTTWQASNYRIYVALKPETNMAQFNKKVTDGIINNYYIPDMIKSGDKNASKIKNALTMRVQNVEDINLRSYDIHDGMSHGDIRFIWLFGAVAGFILLIACINFINLSTAKSANRAKEVGLRKVVGSQRSGLIQQFLTESLLYSFFSFALGLILAVILLPYFNMLASKSLTIPWQQWWLLPTVLVSAVIIGVVAGIYPAFYLSGFKPAEVLKGKLSSGSKSSGLRNGLVVFQFTTSIILIISTFIIYNQMQFILNKKVGFEKDQVVMIQGTNTLDNEVKNFKEELLKLPAVKSVSISDFLPVAGTKRNGNPFYNEGKVKTETSVGGQFWDIDADYIKTFGMKLVAGRNFNPAMKTDSQAVIINQTLAKRLNLKNPVGKRISNGGDPMLVIGVVQDFNFESLRDGIEPLVLHLSNSNSIVSVKVKTGDMKNTLAEITRTWKSFSPNQPIRYTFMDERFASMYADVQRMGRIFTSFAILAIIIACLGLFALAAYMAEQRSKEIGIRKVLGASIGNITTLLSLNFIKLVFIAIVIASPIAWWAMTKWLQDFTYRIPIGWEVFVFAGIVAISIALLTVSFQSIKAAIANPIKSLKSE